jgi:D-alanine-D-alanine ligase
MSYRKVSVIMGGTSSERQVSLASGEAVAQALNEQGFDARSIVLGPGDDALSMLAGADMDAAFLALHGKLGEDGCVQGLLELLGIPYTGSSVLSSALAMDKLKSKELFRLHNVPTPPYYVYDQKAGDVAEVHGSFGFPVIVKPRREGSSIGVSRANDMAELCEAIELALAFDSSVLVERFVQAREVAVGILDGRVLGAIEIAPKSGIYDFAAKYTPGATEYFMPARLQPARYRNVLNLAERAAEALDTTGAVRVDLLVTEGQNEYVLEVNTLPGMTPTSLLPKIAGATGYGFGELCAAIMQGARLHTRKPEPRSSIHQVATPAAPLSIPAMDEESVVVRRGYGAPRRSQRSRTA